MNNVLSNREFPIHFRFDISYVVETIVHHFFVDVREYLEDDFRRAVSQWTNIGDISKRIDRKTRAGTIL